MKKICSLSILLSLAWCLMAQTRQVCVPCLSQGITFSAQAQIDSFQADYPGCTKILGDVKIHGSSWFDITNLNGLSVLTSLGGGMEISSNHALPGLTGLDNLTSVGGDISMTDNTGLVSLEALKNLTSITGDLKITQNSMTNLEGLNNVTSISGDLILKDNIILTSLTGLDHLTSINGGLYIGWNYELVSLTGLDSLSTIGSYLVIEGNPNLTALAGLDNLTSIGDSAVIYWDDGLTTLSGLGKLASIGGGLRIDSNYDLDSIDGPVNLLSVGGDLDIEANQALSGLRGFDNLTSIGGDLNINYNLGLPVIKGFDNLSSIGGDLIFYHNDVLTGITGLSKLNSTGGNVFILSNIDLSGLSGLNSLTSIGGDLYLDSNHHLKDLTGLDHVTFLGNGIHISWNSELSSLAGLGLLDSIPGDFVVFGNDSLAGFPGMNSLVSIGGDFTIAFNKTLTSLTGLDRIHSIGGKLEINDNPALTSLNSLDSLAHLGGDLIITQNTSLAGLAGLDHIDTGSIMNLTITHNFMLSACAAKSICDYLANPGGAVEIFDNAVGCNDQQEVEDACAGKITIDLIFSAADSTAYVLLDSIKVMNRTNGGDTVIYRPDTALRLKLTVGDTLLYIGYATFQPYGVRDLNTNTENFILRQNYPNPVTDQGIISLCIPEDGMVDLIVTDVAGRIVLSTGKRLEKGEHSFSFRPGGGSFFVLTARWKGKSRSIKILSAGSNPGTGCSVEYAGPASGASPLKFFSPGANPIMKESGILDAPDTSKAYCFQFATNRPCHGIPTVDYEGQAYHTVQIFSQCWLKENLNTGTMISGDRDQTDNGIIEKYCFSNQPDSCTKYGGLYQWDEMMQYGQIQGAKGICPPGWHLPTDEEWKVLEGAVDSRFGIGDSVWDYDLMNRGYDAGTNLKAATGWKYEGNGSDLYGFSGLPGGIRFDGGLFYYTCESGSWWTSSLDYTEPLPWYRTLNFGNAYPSRGSDSNKTRGGSVRCVLDEVAGKKRNM
jgi:uncharacterized protein (TIGR02145 family)